MSAETKGKQDEVICGGIIALLYIIGLLIFLPKILYPYGDSWFYCRNVYDTLSSGKITFADAQAATPIFQIWLGTALCKITGGFAFWKLNILAYLFSFLAAIFTYRFIRLFTRTAWLALLGAVLLMGMPPFFKTSMAFMTDPFFYFGMILAFYYGARYIGVGKGNGEEDTHGSRVAMILTAVGFSIAILNRTNALVTFLAFLIFVFIHRKKLKPKLIDWTVHILPLIVFIAFNAWLKITDSAPYYLGIFVQKMFLSYLYNSLISREIFGFLIGKVELFAKWAGYLGVLLLPLTLWIFIRSWDKWRGGEGNRIKPQAGRMIWFILVPMLVIIALVLISCPAERVILPNTITAYGLGVKNVILPNASPLFSSDFFTVLQILVGIGGIIIGVAAIGRVLEDLPSVRGSAFIWWMLLSTAAFPLITQVFSDRYLIPIFPLIFILFAEGVEAKGRMPRWVWVFPIALIIGVGLLANEYFGWNTARWKAIANSEVGSDLRAVGLVDSERIGPLVEGGLEYSGFRYYDDEKFLESYKALWEGGKARGLREDEEYGFVPEYVIWWNLPREYDYILRERFHPPPMLIEGQPPDLWKSYGRAEYKPFPWSERKSVILYRPSPYPETNPIK